MCFGAHVSVPAAQDGFPFKGLQALPVPLQILSPQWVDRVLQWEKGLGSRGPKSQALKMLARVPGRGAYLFLWPQYPKGEEGPEKY